MTARRPSIRFRLLLGSALLTALVLGLGALSLYRSIRNAAWKELDEKLHHEAILLSKSAELTHVGIVYEWQMALASSGGPDLYGLFQFWDLRSGKTTRSPDLGDLDLPSFHGRLHEFIYRDIILADGTPARAVGLLHNPFAGSFATEAIHNSGIDPKLENHQQILVCARSIRGVESHLTATRRQLLRHSLTALAATWLAIFLITKWSLRPIDKLAENLSRRPIDSHAPLPEIPADLPQELLALASAYNEALGRVERARAHEKDFAYSAAHELRTPVSGIQAILEQALFKPRDAESLRHRVGLALGLTQRVRDTIGSLMRLARLRGGLEEPERELYDPDAIVRGLVAEETERDDDALGIDFPPSPTAREMTGDPGLFQILAANLVENAFRYSPPGGRIGITTECSGEMFQLAISNDRGSFDPADAERIFRPFERGTEISVDSPGAGLGLPLSSEIAMLLGGSLLLEITEPDRLTFRLRLPELY